MLALARFKFLFARALEGFFLFGVLVFSKPYLFPFLSHLGMYGIGIVFVIHQEIYTLSVFHGSAYQWMS